MADFTDKQRKITLLVSFLITDTVYLKTDPEQLPRIITAIVVRPQDIIYEVVSGKDLSNHYDFELSKEKTL
jgi:hypothetical protein